MHFDGAIFDMDGVITDTASVHFRAWKAMFDDFLQRRDGARSAPFARADYVTTVDGKPRMQGVEAFLRARGIVVPFGGAGDAPDAETICGLGNRKDILFNRIVDSEGVVVFSSTLELVSNLRDAGIKVGVATSSRNGGRILARAGIDGMFEATLDGNSAATRGLKGKPEPDTFRAVSDMLETAPRRTMIVEDAAAGVEAGARGGFGFVLGVARDGAPEALIARGADRVVRDLSEISLDAVDDWFASRPNAMTHPLPAVCR